MEVRGCGNKRRCKSMSYFGRGMADAFYISVHTRLESKTQEQLRGLHWTIQIMLHVVSLPDQLTFGQRGQDHRFCQGRIPLIVIIEKHLVANLLDDTETTVVPLNIASRQLMGSLHIACTRASCEPISICSCVSIVVSQRSLNSLPSIFSNLNETRFKFGHKS